MKEQNLINYLLRYKIKLADLRLLKYLSKQKKPVKPYNIEKDAKINYYVLNKSISKLSILNLIKICLLDRKCVLNKSNPIIKKLFR